MTRDATAQGDARRRWIGLGARRSVSTLLVAVAMGAVTAPADGAASVRELPFLPLGRDRVTTCLSAPGGDRAAVTDTQPFSVRGVHLLRVTPAGDLVPDGAVPLGRMIDCPRTAVASTGAAVVAGLVGAADEAAVRIAVRDAGGDFGSPARIDLPDRAFIADNAVAVAVAPDGAAVVAWTELLRGGERVRVVRRPAGGAFGTAQTALAADSVQEIPIAVAMDPAGTASLAWARAGLGRRDVVEMTSAAPGGRFSAPQRFPAGLDAHALAVATAPDGGLLLVDAERDAVRVFERAPGERALHPGPLFRAPRVAAQPVAALAAGGGATVAWELVSEHGRRDVRAALRAPGAAFSAPVSLPGGGRASLDDVRDPVEGKALTAAVASDGGAIVGWLATSPTFASDRLVRAWAATGSVTAGFEPPVAVSSPGRSAGGVAALATPRALLWFDNRSAPGYDGDRFALGDGRLHRALAGLPPAPSIAAPALRVTARPQRVHVGDRIVVRAHCSAACDLRAVSARPRGAFATAQLRGAGTRTMRLSAIGTGPLARRDRRPLRVVVHATAPGGVAVAERRLAVPLRRAFTPRPRPPRDVRVVRRGDRLIVTFRTRRPARRELFTVRATGPGPDEFLDQSFADGGGRTRFRLVTTSARETDRLVLSWRSTEPGLQGGRLRLDVPPRR